MELPLNLKADGRVETARNAKITNNRTKDIKVSEVELKLDDEKGWSINPNLNDY